jgi:hypothetical protein
LQQASSATDKAGRFIKLAIPILALWLKLSCGINIDQFVLVITALQYIVFKFFFLLVQGLPPELLELLESFQFPSLGTNFDLVAKQLGITPIINRTVCCPQCFRLYPLHAPLRCNWRKTKKSRDCGAEMYQIRMHNGQKCVPKRLFSTVSFRQWLEDFLSTPGVEVQVQSHFIPRFNDGKMSDLWDSPQWKEFRIAPSEPPFLSQVGNLAFSLFIDWYNPYTNKIAGKKVSLGVIQMACLNLPPEERYRHHNIFIAGMTPGPNEPSIITINHVIQPLVDELKILANGFLFKTPHFPDGKTFRVAVMASICDIPAIHKLAGFPSHSARYFCHYDMLPREQIENVEVESWPRRDPRQHLEAADLWLKAETLREKDHIFKTRGARYSALNQLHYRDPINHNILGVLHAICLGICQHHCRVKWGLGGQIPESQVTSNQSGSNDHPLASSEYIEGLAMEIDQDLQVELDELYQEALNSGTGPPLHSQRRSANGGSAREEVADGDQTREDEPDSNNNQRDGDQDGQWSEDDEDDEDFILDDSVESGSLSESLSSFTDQPKFNEAQLDQINAIFAAIMTPTWFSGPQLPIGKAAHGKVKADGWFSLITLYFPFGLVQIWRSFEFRQLLDNFFNLAVCVNVACSYTTSNEDADIFASNYKQYRKSSQQLWPTIRSVPNHHYCAHIPELLKQWGPLMALSEWAYERVIGQLQRINVNPQMCKKNSVDLTL